MPLQSADTLAPSPHPLASALARRADLQLVSPRVPLPIRIHGSGDLAFRRLIELVEQSDRSIDVRAFVWRDDETGRELARALLRAAERGVHVRIRKDRIGSNYEYMSPSGQSLFHKRLDASQRVRTWFLSTVYGGKAFPRQRTSPIAHALAEHPNVTLSLRKTFDHSKLFVFDESRILLGSMGIGDNHRYEWLDTMVEIESGAMVRRLRERLSGIASFEPNRQLDFLVHSRASSASNGCPLLGERLALIDAARQRISVEMAYLGDSRFTDALLRAVRRGVQTTLITSAQADVLGDLNLGTCDQLLRRAKGASNLTIVLHPRVVHSKVLVVDGQITDVGSANFTKISHGVYEEVDLYVDDSDFASEVEQLLGAHASEGTVVEDRVVFRRHYWVVERGFIAFFSRNAAK